MRPQIQWVKNDNLKPEITGVGMAYFNLAEMDKVRRFHRTIPQYRETPLHRLEHLARRLGVKEILVKDEASRFGLNAFKVLGASYAISKRLAQKLNQDIGAIDFEALKSQAVKEKFPDLVFAAATDGNHGKGVAWTANQLGYPSIIHMPKGTTVERYQNILHFGAEGVITDFNYDETVDRLAALADERQWLMIQDTECLGCKEVPLWIMQGYGTMALEVLDHLRGERPTHIFLQAGVGAFASVMTVIFKSLFKENPPRVIVVEPNKADCFYRSMVQGQKMVVADEMDSIMAGLCCGVPNPVAWEILKDQADLFVSVPDWITANGMRMLGNPLNGDPAIISGESGAVSIGVLEYLSRNPGWMEGFGLDRDAKIITFSTEGDTDRAMYRRIVWQGAYPEPEEVLGK